MDEETIEVAPSEESGNVPAEEVLAAPSEPTETETPAEVVETVETTEPEPETFELPDGRKVDPETLAREWKENFMPEFTKKSQELARLKSETEPVIQPQSKYADPAYVPQTYDEIAEEGARRALAAIEQREQERVQGQKAIEDAVISQLEEVKTADPTVSESALFMHATKYKFTDLRAAHQNMKDMREMAKKVQQTTTENIARRADPISASPGATGTKLNPDDFGSAREYLQALKGSS